MNNTETEEIQETGIEVEFSTITGATDYAPRENGKPLWPDDTPSASVIEKVTLVGVELPLRELDLLPYYEDDSGYEVEVEEAVHKWLEGKVNAQ